MNTIRVGDWVRVEKTALWRSYHNRVGRVFYVTNPDWSDEIAECMVNFEPWNENAPDSAFEGFLVTAVSRVSDMEVVARLAL